MCFISICLTVGFNYTFNQKLKIWHQYFYSLPWRGGRVYGDSKSYLLYLILKIAYICSKIEFQVVYFFTKAICFFQTSPSAFTLHFVYTTAYHLLHNSFPLFSVQYTEITVSNYEKSERAVVQTFLEASVKKFLDKYSLFWIIHYWCKKLWWFKNLFPFVIHLSLSQDNILHWSGRSLVSSKIMQKSLEKCYYMGKKGGLSTWPPTSCFLSNQCYLLELNFSLYICPFFKCSCQ